MSTAHIMYNMALNLAKENSDYLWLAILGATELLIHNKISHV